MKRLISSIKVVFWGSAILIISLVLFVAPQRHGQAADLTASDAASLITAINTANSNAEADTITLTADISLTAVDNTTINGPNGLPLITSPITINGNGFTIARNNNLLCDDPNLRFRIFHVNPAGNLTLDNVSVRNGCGYEGGGIYNGGGRVTISNSTLSDNSAITQNGGGAVRLAGGTVAVSNSTLSGNLARDGFGGAISSAFGTVIIDANSVLSFNSAGRGGAIFNDGGTVSITNSALTGNSISTAQASDGAIYNFRGNMDISSSTVSQNNGGGISNSNSGTLSISGSELSDNNGSGISNSGMVTISNSSLSGNSAANHSGGGIDNAGNADIANSMLSGNSGTSGGGINNTGDVDITNSTLTGNFAQFNGGGIQNIGTRGIVTIRNSTLSGNSAVQFGGGIYDGGTSISRMTISNSTLSGNSAANGGGAIHISTGKVTVGNSTLSGNLSQLAGGIFNEIGTLTISNSIVANSQKSGCSGGGTFNATNNLAPPPCGTDVVSGLDAVLADNGGPTYTHALLEGSNAIDAAINCPPPSTDQRGQTRPLGDRCDIGAYESPFTAPPGSCVDTDQDGVCDVEEMSGPNNGDGNNDGILDSEQGHVATLQNTVDGGYVTLITDSGTLVDAQAVTNPSPANAPAGVDFPVGFFEYTIQDVPSGGSVTVTMLLPPDITVNTFYKYGSTGWYPFLYQTSTATGAEIYDDDNDGDTDRIVLHFVDGLRGDDDLTVNGRIVEPGAPGYLLNQSPIVGPISGPADPVQIGTEVSLAADFSDPDDGDTHTATWEWGDTSSSDGVIDETAGTVTGNHIYTETGVYPGTLTIRNEAGESDTAIFQFIVIYDPEGGFVTGGGWIDSPAGAYADDPDLTGKANFGFVSRYKKGATEPTGVTEFQFKVAGLNFRSNTYEWLVIAGAKAQYKGVGTINGAGEYKFLLTGIDADINDNDGFTADRFRIKIWSEDAEGVETVIYDNGLEADLEDDNSATEIGGGSIAIHK